MPTISASEQKSVFVDLAKWLRQVLPKGVRISISNMCDDVDSISIVPIKGTIASKYYACGGYEVYLPFALYYRTMATDNERNAYALNLLDSIGLTLEANNPTVELTDGRQLLECYQDSTSVKFKQTGAIGDFMANFVIKYARDN